MDAGTGFMWLQQAGCTKNQKLAPGHVHDADERSDYIIWLWAREIRLDKAKLTLFAHHYRIKF
jgi:hypothetical protein